MDFKQPELHDHYAGVLESIREAVATLAAWLEDGTPEHTPVGTKRWSQKNQRFERFDGTVWQPLAQQYQINVDRLAGRAAGHGPGHIPINDGRLNDNLNAEKLGGHRAAYYASQADNAARVAKAGDAMTGPLTLSGDAEQPLQAVTKQQLEQAQQSAIPADGSVRTAKIAPEAVTADKLAKEAVVDHLGYTPADVTQTWTKDNLDPQHLHLRGVQMLQSEDGKTSKRFRCQDDRFEILSGQGTAVIFRVQQEGSISNNWWLHLNNPNDGSTRSVHHNEGTIGFVGQDRAWKLRVQDDGNVWTSRFGYFHDAFTPRSSLSLYGLGSVAIGVAGSGQPGQVRAMPGFPGAWRLITPNGLPNNFWLSVRIA